MSCYIFLKRKRDVRKKVWINNCNQRTSLIMNVLPYAIYLWNNSIWATTWQNHQNDCAPSEDSDQPVHPPSLISLGIHPVWSESSLCAQWVAKDPRFLHADSEVSDQTGRMPRQIWVFAGRTITLLVLSCRGSYVEGLITSLTHGVSAISCHWNNQQYIVCRNINGGFTKGGA